MGETFTINRLELRKMLISMGVGEKNLAELESTLKKLHRHVNAVAFVGLLQKYGLKQADVANIMRRIGIDDLSITNVLNSLDEQKMSETYGRIVELSIAQ